MKPSTKGMGWDGMGWDIKDRWVETWTKMGKEEKKIHAIIGTSSHSTSGSKSTIRMSYMPNRLLGVIPWGIRSMFPMSLQLVSYIQKLDYANLDSTRYYSKFSNPYSTRLSTYYAKHIIRHIPLPHILNRPDMLFKRRSTFTWESG